VCALLFLNHSSDVCYFKCTNAITKLTKTRDKCSSVATVGGGGVGGTERHVPPTSPRPVYGIRPDPCRKFIGVGYVNRNVRCEQSTVTL
jgi:hypothetical protein